VKRKLTVLIMTLALLSSFIMPIAVFAAGNPVVTITVSAQVVAITNSEDTWDIGIIEPSAVLYFSATNEQNDDYSTITNTGNVDVDIEIQGTDLVPVDPTYTWTLAAASDNQTYSLYANTPSGGSSYTIEIQSSVYEYPLVEDLAPDGTYLWSMKLTAPDEFHAGDDGEPKSGSVTLVATKSE
jgi:hypothetical protein